MEVLAHLHYVALYFDATLQCSDLFVIRIGVLTVFIVRTVLGIADSDKCRPIIHANKDLTYRPVDDHDAKDGSESKNILRVKSDENDYSNNFGEDKIVGGVGAEINLYPYHVAYGTTCGGVIIDKNWVMTTAHCGTKDHIRYGSKYLNQGTKVNIKANFIHHMFYDRYKIHPLDYDFQVLQLAEPIILGSNAQPIQLGHSYDLIVGETVTVTGWGYIHEDGPYSNVLRAVRVPIVSKKDCQKLDLPCFRGKLTPRMFCAGYEKGSKDACQGDSGGPATVNNKLLGLVSFGYGCAAPGTYGVYSKVGHVKSWISEITGLQIT